MAVKQWHRFFSIPAGWLILAGLAAGQAGCGGQENTYAPPPPPKVTVARPVRQTITRFSEFTGTTRASALVDIRARVEGYLEAVHFEPGVEVEKGSLLFEIDPKPYIAELNRAKADVAIREAEVKQAEAGWTRRQQALRSKAASEIEVIDALAAMEKAKASLLAAAAAVEKAELQLSYTKIHAPIGGKIGRSLVDSGNLVGAAGEKTLLTTIVDDRPVFAYFTVSETDLLLYRKKTRQREADGAGAGDDYSPDNYPVFLGASGEEGYPHRGRLEYIETRMDETTGTIEVRGVFDNEDGSLLPGLFARIRVPVGAPRPALLVPESALGTDQAGRYLLTVDDRNIVEYRSVVAGQAEGGMRAIESGVGPEDRIVVNGILKARPGQPVSPVSADADGKPEGGAS
jgi:RND family efflux transporter MFP subunit